MLRRARRAAPPQLPARETHAHHSDPVYGNRPPLRPGRPAKPQRPQALRPTTNPRREDSPCSVAHSAPLHTESPLGIPQAAHGGEVVSPTGFEPVSPA